MLLKKILAFSLALLLSACGYHLRGNLELPAGAENIYVEAASGALQQEMRKALKPAHSKLVDSVNDAGLVIKFSKEIMDSRVMSMNTAGRANQFQLIYELIFSIYDSKGKALLTDQNVKIKRDYFNDQTDILGKSNEEAVIRVEMYQQAVSSILNRVNLALESKTKTTAAK